MFGPVKGIPNMLKFMILEIDELKSSQLAKFDPVQWEANLPVEANVLRDKTKFLFPERDDMFWSITYLVFMAYMWPKRECISYSERFEDGCVPLRESVVKSMSRP